MTMTKEEALRFLYKEFILRFGLSAEDCIDPAATVLAISTLATFLNCPSPITGEEWK